MRKTLLASIAVLAALSITTADAADKKKAATAKSKPVAAAAAPVVVAAKKHNWTGVYAGVNAGAAWNSTSTKFAYSDYLINNVPANALPGKLSSRSTGFTGGAQIGYNHQIDQYVVGAEIDFQNIGRNKKIYSVNSPHGNGDPDQVTSVVNSGTEWLGTGRIKAGYTFDNMLFYATGGLAMGSVKTAITTDTLSIPVRASDGQYFTASKSETKWGWALGLGTEYAVTQNISIKAEYLHYNLGSVTVASIPNAAAIALDSPNPIATTKFSISGDLVRVGLNHRF